MTGTAKLGEVGLPIVITTGFDLTGYSAISLTVYKPSGAVDAWTPTVTTIATGVLTYETQAGDLDESGNYKIQGYFEFVDGDKRYSDAVQFRVLAIGEEI